MTAQTKGFAVGVAVGVGLVYVWRQASNKAT